jgi:capsular exopolysaccharide synthesis family protein
MSQEVTMPNLIVREHPDRSLREFSYVIFRHRKRTVCFFLIVTILVTLITMLMPRTYRSEAKLLLRLGRESATIDPTASVTGQLIQITQRRESEIKSELEILKSRDMAEKVVDVVGSDILVSKPFFGGSDKQKQHDRAVRKVMENWDIGADRDSNIINVAYEASSPKVAQDVVATLIDAYLEKHLAVNRSKGSYDFFKEQTDKAAAELASTEAKLAALKNETGLSSVDEQRRITLERLGVIQRELEGTKADSKVSQAKSAAMKDLLARLPETVVTAKTSGYPNIAADGMRQKLYELQLKEQELLSKYTEKNFLVQETQRQIQNAKSLLKTEEPARAQVTKALDAAHQQTKTAFVAEETNAKALETKAGALVVNLANVRDELKALNSNEVQIARLQRQKEIQEASYREYAKKKEETRIASALETEKISNISVAQGATYPLRPTSPRTALNLVLGVMFATVGAVGLAFLAESLDHSFKRPEDIGKHLNLPLLASIPLLQEDQDLVDPGKALPFLVPDARVRCGLLGEAGECYETLCHSLMQNDAAACPQVIGVISCHHEEGASTVAANFAATLAGRCNERVLLVEANLIRPSAHMTFGIFPTPGLTDIIADRQDLFASIKHSNRSNLDVIPSGKGELTLSQLADSKIFSEMLDILKAEYSYVIFDLPPLFKSNSALRLASRTDGVIMVIGAEGVSWQVAQRAKERFLETKTKVLGVVLNKRVYHIPEWLYRRL